MNTDTPRTYAAIIRCGFGDMAIMERQLQAVTNALRSMVKEFDHPSRTLDPEISPDVPRIEARAALAMLNATSPFKP
jgi:hypothetical protein